MPEREPELASHLPGQPTVEVPPVPLPAPLAVRWRAVYWAPSTYLRGHLAIHALAFWAIAASMWLQSERYTFATNRGLLFLLAAISPDQWAVIFGVVGTAKAAACLVYPRLTRWVVLFGMLLVSWWAAGFATAWLIANSTILGLVAWTLMIGEHFAALTLLTSRRRWREDE